MIHLHTQSAYSLLHSPIRIEQLVQKATSEQKSAVALTDKDVLFGVPSFLRACRQYGIKPIIGMEIEAQHEEETFGFVLLAENNTGLQSLYRLSTMAGNTELTLQNIGEN